MNRAAALPQPKRDVTASSMPERPVSNGRLMIDGG
jgi:hypothetical protein